MFDSTTKIQTDRGEVTLAYLELGLTTNEGVPAVKGFCVKEGTGELGLCVNASYPPDVQENTLRIGINHINAGHMDDTLLLPIGDDLNTNQA